ncbi:hypothetical protein JTB14_014274 [Gonioctena quinquepunctata]|nr:hypothetical protein JTB14_014274 [Gonioctena quinquepunctata]
MENFDEVLDFVDMGYPRRIFLRPNYYEEMSQMDFFRRFRLTKPTVITLLTQIENQLEYPDDRTNSLSPMNQLLLTLRFYTSSGHMIQTADFMNVHVSTVSRVIAYVSPLIAYLRPRVVIMPHHQQRVRAQNEFFNIAGFPKVQALIDCTHVKIDSPSAFLSFERLVLNLPRKNIMDLPELFQTGFQNLHKQTLEKNYQQKTLKKRMDDFRYIRRQTRDALLFQMRKLEVIEESPIKKVEAERKTAAPSNERLEMLIKWKEDKTKRKQEEKKNAKTIFKVCHITRDQGVSKFGPMEHTFRPPVNVKPIHFVTFVKTTQVCQPGNLESKQLAGGASRKKNNCPKTRKRQI